MRLNFLWVLSVLVGWAVAPGLHAQALWRGVPAGASPAEVVRWIPEAQPGTAVQADPAAQVLLEIPRTDLEGADFSVHFVFDRERLQQVVLRSQAGSVEAANTLARRLYTVLRARYGLEQSTRSRGISSSVLLDRRWVFRRTTVHLQVTEGAQVVLTYGVDAPRPSSAW